MKKITFVLLIAALMSLFTSCKVNWFDQQYDLPWWMIAIPVVILLTVTWFFGGKYIASKEYICPKCGKNFHPKWWNAAFSVHINNDRVFKCPHCGRKGFCSPSKKSKD